VSISHLRLSRTVSLCGSKIWARVGYTKGSVFTTLASEEDIIDVLLRVEIEVGCW
jgi:hypothetical protein